MTYLKLSLNKEASEMFDRIKEHIGLTDSKAGSRIIRTAYEQIFYDEIDNGMKNNI
jgi:hypothetical protein